MNRHLSKFLLNIFCPARMKTLKELLKSQYYSRDQLLEKQNAKFLKLIRHARINVPHYRKILENASIKSIDEITSVPFLTKEIIQTNTTDLKAGNLSAYRFQHNATGGSTGEKLKYFSDKNARRPAFQMRNNMWAGWKIGEKQVKLWGSFYDLSRTQGLDKKIKNFLVYRTLILSSYNMSEADMHDYRLKINRYKPSLITGYASALYLISRFIRDNKLYVFSPRGIISSAENLQEHQRRIIESVFQCPVLDRYGCSWKYRS